MENSNIFLKSLTVDNYKSLKDSSIELQGGLNIIIGKNGAGKSNLLDFIYNYTGSDFIRIPSRNLSTSFLISIVYDTEASKNILSYEVKKARKNEAINGKESSYSYDLVINKQENQKFTIKDKKFKITPTGRKTTAGPNSKMIGELDVLNHLNKRYIKFEIPENAPWLSKSIRLTIDEYANFDDPYSGFSFFNDLEFDIELGSGFEENLPDDVTKDKKLLRNYLLSYLDDYLKSSHINLILERYTPITEIRFNPNLNIYSNDEKTIIENLSVDFFFDGDWMPWSYLSDGTKRLFYLISECISIDNGVILIEEPELGIHPHQLLKILDFLREQSRTKQVIISTHSPLTLDILKENELSRIIVAKHEKGTKFSKLSKAEISKARRYIDEVGELSYYWLHSDLEK